MHLLVQWFRHLLARIGAGMRWIWRWIGYPEWFVVLYIVYTEVVLLLTVVVWIGEHIFLRIPVSLLSVFWLIAFNLLPLLVFPIIVFALVRNRVVRIMMQSRDPNRYMLALVSRQQAQLTYLRVKAREENEYRYYWKNHRLPDAGQSLPFSRFAGFNSFSYAMMSRYFGLPLKLEADGSEEEQLFVEVPLPSSDPPSSQAQPLFPLLEPEREENDEELTPTTPTGVADADPPVVEGPEQPPERVPDAEVQNTVGPALVSSDSSLASEEQPLLEQHRDQRFAPYTLLLFGEPRFRLRGERVVEVPIIGKRAWELLAYLGGGPGRKHACTRKTIVFDIYEEHALSTQKEEKLGNIDYPAIAQRAFAYDVDRLGKLLGKKCAEAGLPYIDPITSTHGTDARHRLADAYSVEDVARLEQVVERLTVLKQEEEPPCDLEAFRKECEAVHECYDRGGGFLGSQKRALAAPWHREYFTFYQDLYERLVWDLARYEQIVSRQQEGRERKASLEQSATWYKRYAFLTALSAEELEAGTSASHSEKALRQWMLITGRALGKRSDVHPIYRSYLRLLKEKYREAQLQPETDQTYREVTDSSGTS